MKKINDILGYKNRKIYQDDEYFSFSIDSVMIANFASIRLRDKEIVDLGCGNGVIPLILSLRTSKNIIGVELQKQLCELANDSVKYNKLENQISIVNQNMKDFAINNIEKYDLVVCNPPYFKLNDKSCLNDSPQKIIARHEVEITLSEVFGVAKKILKNNGNFALVHRADRLLEIFDLYRQNGIEPKRIQFVYDKLSRDSILILVEGQKNGKPGLKIEKPFYLYNEDGTKSFEYNKLFTEVIE